MKIAIGCDHGAFDLKNAVVKHLLLGVGEQVFVVDNLCICAYRHRTRKGCYK